MTETLIMATTQLNPIPPAPRKPKRWPWVVLGIIVGFVVVVSLASPGKTPTPAFKSGASAAATAGAVAGVPTEVYTSPEAKPQAGPASAIYPWSEEPAAPVAAGPLTSMDDGTWVGGEDVKVGRYKSPGVDSSPITGAELCYFQVSKNGQMLTQSQKFGATQQGPSIVNLGNGETLVTNGCKPWVLS